jgi:hypothetical protein
MSAFRPEADQAMQSAEGPACAISGHRRSTKRELCKGLFADRPLSVLEIQMQVSPMDVVGLGAEHR